MRWTTSLWLFLTGFIAFGYASDPLLSTERLFRARQPWTDPAGIGLICLIGTRFSWWMTRETKAIVVVSEAAIELQRPGRRARRIAWNDVTCVRYGGLSRQLSIRSSMDRVTVSNQIENYGRLLNLVLTRSPGISGTVRLEDMTGLASDFRVG